MFDLRHNCPECGRPLDDILERELPADRRPPAKVIHAGHGTYVRREAAGIEVIGMCMMHGLVRNIPMVPCSN